MSVNVNTIKKGDNSIGVFAMQWSPLPQDGCKVALERRNVESEVRVKLPGEWWRRCTVQEADSNGPRVWLICYAHIGVYAINIAAQR